MDPEGAPGSSEPEDAATTGDRPRRRRLVAGRPVWQQTLAVVLVSLVVAVLVRALLVQLFYIPSGSMRPTLERGDRVAVNKLAYRFGEVRRGDVVVFDGAGVLTAAEHDVDEPGTPWGRALRAAGRLVGLGPSDEDDYVKRVVGVGGDRVQCCDELGRLLVNGVPVDEPYLFPGDEPSVDPFDVQVPDGRLFVLGDHRSASSDSRAYLGAPGGGMVPEEAVVGRVEAVVWPLSRAGRVRGDGGLAAVPTATSGRGDAPSVPGGPVAVLLPLAAVRWPPARWRSHRAERRRGEP